MSKDIKRPLKSYKGSVYDLAYTSEEIVYDSVEDFINDISDIEINIAMSEFPNNYQKDKIFQRYRRLKDSQEISEKELDELLGYYNYDVR